ncbi:MAG: hypothetical protein H6617_07705 [Bdellovibrionaceae bacterium]|nr:hypothetical protein [Pseudobdellovibrionaceae bacterium]
MKILILGALSLALFFTIRSHGESIFEKAEKAIATLESQNFETREGGFAVIGNEDCAGLIKVFGNCFGNNPAAPYLVPLIPRHPKEYIDPFYHTELFLGETQNRSFTYRLRADEAILIVGVTPPKAAYFGAQSYNFTRAGTTVSVPNIDGLNILFTGSPNPDRYISFSSIGNSLNNYVIAKKLGSGFGQPFALISTPSQETNAELRAALRNAGFSAAGIFTEPIPSETKLGLSSEADDFSMLVRYALPESEAQGNAWRTNPSLRVYRLSRKAATATERFGSIQIDSRSADGEGTMGLALEDFTREVAVRLGQPRLIKVKEFVSPAFLVGENCLKLHMNCLGDTQDTDTYRTGSVPSFSHSDVVVITGINHAVTGNASYISLGFSVAETFTGISSVSQTSPNAGFVSGELTGSAEAFLKKVGNGIPLRLRASAPKFFVRLVARQCEGLPFCTTISDAQLPLNQDLTVLRRAYIRPGTVRGPDPSKLLSPRYFVYER